MSIQAHTLKVAATCFQMLDNGAYLYCWMVIFEVYERSLVGDGHSLALHFDAPFQNKMAPCQFDERF